MDWRFSTFLLFLFALFVGIPWATSETGLCGMKIAQKAMTGDDATNCAEFWFNRYQSLFGTIATIIAVYFAWKGVSRQVDRADIQLDLTRKQLAADSMAAVESRLIYANTILDAMVQLAVYEQAVLTWIGEMQNAATSIADAIDQAKTNYVDIYQGDFLDAQNRMRNVMRAFEQAHDRLKADMRMMVFSQSMHTEVLAWLMHATQSTQRIGSVAPYLDPKISINSDPAVVGKTFRGLAGYAAQRPDPQLFKGNRVIDLVRAERDRLSILRDGLVRQMEERQ